MKSVCVLMFLLEQLEQLEQQRTDIYLHEVNDQQSISLSPPKKALE